MAASRSAKNRYRCAADCGEAMSSLIRAVSRATPALKGSVTAAERRRVIVIVRRGVSDGGAE